MLSLRFLAPNSINSSASTEATVGFQRKKSLHNAEHSEANDLRH